MAPDDYDGDGTVAASDYVLWRRTVGSTTDLRADGNADLVVDDDDYNIWHLAFGQTYTLGNASAAVSVPEPALNSLFLLGFCIVARRRPRRILWMS